MSKERPWQTTRAIEAAIVAVFVVLAWRSWWVTEDAYISFRYALRFIGGEGLTFNDGARVEGYSNPLWVVLCIFLRMLGANLPSVVPLASIALGATMLVSARRTAERHLGMDAIGSLVAMGLGAVAAPIVCWATSGLETMCLGATFWLTAQYAAFAEDRREIQWGAVSAMSLSLVRTEGVAWMFTLVVLAMLLRRLESRSLRPVLSIFGIALAGWLVWFAWKYAYYGDWMSNVARAKVSTGSGVLERGARYAISWHLVSLWPLAVPIGMVTAWRSGVPSLRILWLGALAVAAPVWSIVVGGDYMEHFRFIVPSVLPAALATGWMLQAARHRHTAFGGILALLTLGIAYGPTIDRLVLPDRVLRTTALRNTSDADRLVYRRGKFRSAQEAETTRNLYLESQGMTLLTRPGDKVITSAIGLNGYYNPDLEILDLCGLVSPEIGQRETKVSANDRPGHDKCTGPHSFLDDGPALWGLTLLYNLPLDELADAFRERATQWKKVDRKDKYAPEIVELRGPFSGGVAFAAGMKPVDNGDRRAAWKRWEKSLEAMASGVSPSTLCARSIDKYKATRPHRMILREYIERDGKNCQGVTLAEWIESRR